MLPYEKKNVAHKIEFILLEFILGWCFSGRKLYLSPKHLSPLIQLYTNRFGGAKVWGFTWAYSSEAQPYHALTLFVVNEEFGNMGFKFNKFIITPNYFLNEMIQ